MKQTVRVGISLTVILAFAVAGYMVYNSQMPQGASGAGGIGAPIILDIPDLARESTIVAIGEVASSENVTKTVSDTSQPVDRRGPDYTIETSRIQFTVAEYLRGSDEGVITITMQADERYKGPALSPGTEYVVFLFDPNLKVANSIWGDTYLPLGGQAIWQVNGANVSRTHPPTVMTLEDLKSQVNKAAN